MNSRGTIIVGVEFLIMAIINYIFVFKTYWPDFYNQFFSVWLYFVMWGAIYFIAPICNCISIFDQVFVFNLISLVSFGTWIWGWVIVGSSSWPLIWSDFRSIANLLLAYQIIWIFINIHIQFVKKNIGKSSNKSVNNNACLPVYAEQKADNPKTTYRAFI